MLGNLSSLQRNFIRNCFIFLGFITWLVFGFISVANEWELCCLIFSSPFIFLALFIVFMGIYIFIIRLRFKWQIMGVLTKEEYSSVVHELWLFGWALSLGLSLVLFLRLSFIGILDALFSHCLLFALVYLLLFTVFVYLFFAYALSGRLWAY